MESLDVEKYDTLRWQAFMSRGDFESAWLISDKLLIAHSGVSCVNLPRHLQYIWNGTPLNNKRVLVRCYHGLGDTIQFMRYLPIVNRIAARTFVWIQPELVQLARCMNTQCDFLLLDDNDPQIQYDVDVEIMELPYVFRTTLKTVPPPLFFNVNAADFRKNGFLAVGIVWQGGNWDQHRCIPFSLLARLAQLQGIDIHILQRGKPLAQRPSNFGIDSGSDDIYAAAQTIKSLDLVISVDTMPAHLAGSLGVPVWTLLCKNADWRWMEDREDSPWYPTMRLFRQKKQGRWEQVIEQVLVELTMLRDRAES